MAGVFFADFRDIQQNPTFLEPEEGDARTFNLHHRHFWGETVERLELRRNEGEEKWMRKCKDGTWTEAFQWDYSIHDNP